MICRTEHRPNAAAERVAALFVEEWKQPATTSIGHSSAWFPKIMKALNRDITPSTSLALHHPPPHIVSEYL
jgi:hypothetical protein